MLRAILIPLSYATSWIISKITKEELLIRKKWLTYWPYLLIIVPFAYFMDITACIITISAINYLKSSHDYIYDTRILRILIENLVFAAAGMLAVSL